MYMCPLACNQWLHELAVNALSTPPGEYDRKVETQGNWRGFDQSGGACFLIR